MSETNQVSLFFARQGKISFYISVIIALLLMVGLFGDSCTSGLILPDKTLRLSLEASPKTLDPIYSTDTYSGVILGLTYSNLLRFDESGELVLDAAKHYRISENGRRYDFLLKDNQRFVNGVVMEAEDVAFSLNRLASPHSKSPRAWLLNQVSGFEDFQSGKTKQLEGIQVLDKSRIRITLKRAYAPFLSLFAMPQMSIVSKSYIESGADLGESTMGAGPYYLKTWRREQDILLLSNPHYRKSGNLNAVYYKIIKDPLSLVSEFKAQGLHMIEVPPTEVKSLKSTRARLFPVNQFNLYFVGMNMKSGRFTDRKLRQAIAFAVNREDIIKNLQHGLADIATGPVPKGLKGYLDRDYFSYDLTKAKELFSKSKYDGKPLRLLLRNEARSMAVCQVIQQNLKNLGIEVKLVPRDWNSFSSALVKMDYDLFYRNWIADFPDGDNFLFPLFHSSSTGLKGNYPGYENKNFDSLVERSRRQTDNFERDELLRQAAQLARNDASRVLLWYKTKVYAAYPVLQNFRPFPMYNSNKYLNVNLLTR
ncbi:MAG: ABC transporter substrate-binding protein [bacterium]|nr:ABC transporter substrate-binding protein [bacterium]